MEWSYLYVYIIYEMDVWFVFCYIIFYKYNFFITNILYNVPSSGVFTHFPSCYIFASTLQFYCQFLDYFNNSVEIVL